MAIRAVTLDVEIYRDDEATISKVVTTGGDFVRLFIDTADGHSDTMEVVRLSETEYRPRRGYYGSPCLETLCILYGYREKLKEITGVDFFAGIHVEEIRQSKAQ